MTRQAVGTITAVLLLAVALPSCTESMEEADVGESLQTALATDRTSEFSKSIRQLIWLTHNGTDEQRVGSLEAIETIVRTLEERASTAAGTEPGEPGLSSTIFYASVYKPLAKEIKERRFDIELQALYRTIRPPDDRLELDEQWRSAAEESKVAVFSNILAEWEVHSDVINDVALTQYSTLVSAGDDGRVCVSSLTGRFEPRTLVTHPGWVKGMDVATDSPLGVSGSFDGTIKLWDTSSEELVKSWRSPTEGLRAIAISADGTLVVSGGHDGSLRLWNADSGTLIRSIQVDAKSVAAIALSSDGKIAITVGNSDTILRAWDLQSGNELWNATWSGGAPVSVAVSPDRSLVISGDSTTVRLFSAKDGEQLKDMRLGWGTIYDVRFSRDGHYVVTGSGTKSSTVIDISSWKKVAELSQLDASAKAVYIDVDLGIAVVGDPFGWITLWEFNKAMGASGIP